MQFKEDYSTEQGINKLQPLPSGLVANVEEWTVGDIAGMGERGKGGNLDQMIARCTVHADPRGVYGLQPGEKLPPDRLLTGDRAAVIMLQRILTHWRKCGPYFDFTFSCQDADCYDANPRPIDYSVDLRRFLLTKEDLEAPMLREDQLDEVEDGTAYRSMDGCLLFWHDRFGSLPIVLGSNGKPDMTAFTQGLSDDLLAGFKQGNRFEYLDPYTGKRLYWKLMRGIDENDLSRFRKSPEKYRLNALDRRIIEVEGVQQYNKATWIKSWSAGADDLLQEHLNSLEPGMFKEFEVVCPRCGTLQEITFPLDLGFFSPSSRRKKSGKTS